MPDTLSPEPGMRRLQANPAFILPELTPVLILTCDHPARLTDPDTGIRPPLQLYRNPDIVHQETELIIEFIWIDITDAFIL